MIIEGENGQCRQLLLPESWLATNNSPQAELEVMFDLAGMSKIVTTFAVTEETARDLIAGNLLVHVAYDHQREVAILDTSARIGSSACIAVAARMCSALHKLNLVSHLDGGMLQIAALVCQGLEASQQIIDARLLAVFTVAMINIRAPLLHASAIQAAANACYKNFPQTVSQKSACVKVHCFLCRVVYGILSGSIMQASWMNGRAVCSVLFCLL